MRGTAIAVSAVLFIGLSFRISDYLSKAEAIVQTPVTQASTPVVTVDQNIAIDGHLDALLRAWRITDACYDEAAKVYLVHIAQHKHEEGYTDQGWYMFDRYEFVRLQNGTYIIKATGLLIDVFPDTTGLRCKQQAYVWE